MGTHLSIAVAGAARAVALESIGCALLGFEVDPLNSVSFSNHSGYKVIRKGQILKESDLDEIISGLKANGLDFYTHVLTGYIFSSSFLTRIADLIGHLRKVNPNLVYGKSNLHVLFVSQ
ncbi:unnamed protein product [Bemisia tabaci]|uniref:pyridoxal kinase n=1 Tax=Bemisia tabaci TaxID=7038 RepID=A0A9P0AIZ9_BEMTA|nr:unnamed protein product [Bemisia tabaci]